MSRTPPTPLVRRTVARLGLPIGAALTLGLAAVLGLRTLDLVAELSPATQVDGAVVLAITTAGALLAAWFGMHLLIGTLCVLGAACGRRWRVGERLLAAHGPTLVRRGVALAVGASLGLGGLSVATATGAPSPTDLGWVPTTGLEVEPVSGVDGEGSGSDTSERSDTEQPHVDQPDSRQSEPDHAGSERPDGGKPDTGRSDTTRPADPDGSSDPGGASDVAPGAGTGPGQGDTSEHRSGSGTDEEGGLGNPDGSNEGSDGEVSDDASPTTEAPATQRVVVGFGDSLWSITEVLLGDDASDIEVARAWPALYETNRDVVGPDPNLIHPGQELLVPAVLQERP